MLFYKADINLHDTESEPERNERSERAGAIQSKTELCFIERDRVCHIAVSNIQYRKKKAALCIALRKGALCRDAVSSFLKAVDLDAEIVDTQEITMELYLKMLSTSNRNDYIDDDGEVCERLGISELHNNHRYRDFDFDESIMSDSVSKNKLLSCAESLLCNGSMNAEIERIYKGAQQGCSMGHPTHYVIQSDDIIARNQMLNLILPALYSNGRLQSRRYTVVGLSADNGLSERRLKALYESCCGGTIVVSFAQEDSEDSEFARAGLDVISDICAIMRQYRNKVLTIFCLHSKAEKTKNLFLEHLGAVTVVTIKQETVFGNDAKRYLKARAKEYGVPGDKALYKCVADGRGYSAADLNLCFDEWFDKRLKSKVYTQYAELETANKLVASRKAKGSAIDELEQMIGLSEAKNVIYQALDFYKAQKLFKEKGFSGERPAMHMVFSGNPGTAKTTVARLFAQIMKDNGLLSVGDLYEVGRADLVGKYVGWTAPTVKKKFEAAKGSVLFIDEAYSLVDDRGGSFGDEAINTIVQEMENHREDMVVIFAGYPDKMEGFLQKNPGLRSRIAFHVPFADYNSGELYQITDLFARNKKISLDVSVKEKLLPVFETAMKTGDFGNGRFARNLFEKAVMKQATRLVAMDVDSVTRADIETLIADDFDAPKEIKPEKIVIGFAS